MRPRRALLLIAFLLPSILPATGQSGTAQGGRPAAFLDASLLPPGDGFDITEKSDYRRVVDGKSAGYIYRESRGHVRFGGGSLSPSWEGELYILEETIKDAAVSARKVARVVDLDLSTSRGVVSLSRDSGFPALRGLLDGRPESLDPGISWVSPASIAVDPRNSGSFVVLPVLVEYRVAGPTSYGGGQVLVVKAKFALRLGLPSGPQYTGGELKQASGSHELDIYLDAEGRLVLVRDRFDSSYGFTSGPPERHVGFTLVFYGSSLRADRASALAALGVAGGTASTQAGTASGAAASAGTAGTGSSGAAGGQGGAAPAGGSSSGGSTALGGGSASGGASGAGGAPASTPSSSASGPGPLIAGQGLDLDEGSPLAGAGVDVLDGPQGIVLRIKDLQFVADSADLLPAAKARLDEVAATLSRLPGRSFLVEGHAAGVGKPEGEQVLSELRAKRVVDELVARGIPASSFTYRGLGSTKPLASNSTEAGRAMNRRVEITLLE